MLEYLTEIMVALSIFISLGNSVFTIVTARSSGNETRIDEVDEKVTALTTKVTELEGEMRHLPTQEGQHQLQLAMSDMAGDLKVLAVSMEGTQRTVSRMEQVMMESDKHG